MFPERGRLLSGQQSSTFSRLLYDGLPCFLGSARSSTLRPSTASNNWKTLRTFPALRFKTCRKKEKGNQSESRKKMEIVNQDLDGSLFGSLSTEIPIYMERDLSMNRSSLSSIRIDMSLWATTPIFICFGHVRFRSEEEGLDLSILCREGCDLC